MAEVRMAEVQMPFGERAKVFISYARTNFAVVERLRDSLTAAGFIAYLDLHDILPGEPWQERLGKLIEAADTVIFALSPASVASPIVDWELNEAERLSKRLLPVVIQDPDPERVPGRIKRLNYIFMRGDDDWAANLAKLEYALLIDIEWIREHTRIGDLAGRWAQHPLDEQLLRGAPLVATESWTSKRPHGAPEITDLQRDFLRASRDGEQTRLEQEKKRLAEVASAQSRTRSAQRRTFGVLTLMLVGVIFGLWGVIDFWRSVMSNRSELIANQAQAQTQQFDDPITGMLLALEGLPDASAPRISQRLMPRVDVAAIALDNAWRNSLSRQWQERKPLPGHKSEVTAVNFSPDSTLVATVADMTRLWEVATGKLIATLPGEIGLFSQNGRLIATAVGNNIMLWDGASAQPVATLAGHAKSVISIAFSADGRFLISGSSDKTARVWNLRSGDVKANITGLNDAVSSVAFSPDGRFVATASGEAQIWEASSGKAVATLTENSFSIHDKIVFSHDGRLIATRDADGDVGLWEIETRNKIGVFTGHTYGVLDIVFSPDDRFVATISQAGNFWSNDRGSGNTARLWSTTTGKIAATFTGHTAPVTSIAFSPDGNSVLTGSDDKTARIWEATSGKSVAILSAYGRVGTDPTKYVLFNRSGVNSVAFSPNGAFIATGAGDKTARVWENAEDRIVDILPGHEFLVDDLAFSSDSRFLATSSSTSRVWDLKTGHMDKLNKDNAKQFLSGESMTVYGRKRAAWLRRTLIDNTEFDNAKIFSHDGTLSVTTSADKKVELRDTASGASSATLLAHSEANPIALPVSFSTDNHFVAIANENSIDLSDTRLKGIIATLTGHTDKIVSLAFSPDGRFLASGSDDRTVRIWDAVSRKGTGVLTGHIGSVLSVEFSPNSRLLATSAKNETLMWDTTSSFTKHAVKFQRELGTFIMAFSPDSQLFVAGTSKDAATLWEASSGKATVLRGHTSAVTAIAFSRDSKLIATGSVDNTARVWEAESGRELAILSGHTSAVLAIAFSPDDRTIATGSIDKTARIWPFLPSYQNRIEAAQKLAPRCLTQAQREAFRLPSDAPRWCYDMNLWPFDRSTSSPPPMADWDERIVGAWDWLLELFRPGRSRLSP